MKMFTMILVVAVVVCLTVISTACADWPEEVKLIASDANAGDRFGITVSISGDYAIMGAMWGDGNEVDSGCAYIFKHSDSVNDPNWYEQTKLIASDGETGDYFGYYLSINGNYAIVGAINDDNENGIDAGAAYIFKRSDVSGDPNWYEQQKLLASDGEDGDYFGSSADVSGDYAIFGAYTVNNSTGAAYIFRRMGSTWYEICKLTASDGKHGDVFGHHFIAIDDDYAMVGSNVHDVGELVDSDSVYVFKRVCPTADLSGDCFVEFVDLSISVGQWLKVN